MNSLEFLRTASINTLQAYELSKRNSAANFAQQFKTLLHRVIDDLVEAEMARLAMEVRQDMGKSTESDPFRIDK